MIGLLIQNSELLVKGLWAFDNALVNGVYVSKMSLESLQPLAQHPHDDVSYFEYDEFDQSLNQYIENNPFGEYL